MRSVFQKKDNRLVAFLILFVQSISISGCAPIESSDLIYNGADMAKTKDFVATAKRYDRISQGDEPVADIWWYPIHRAAFLSVPDVVSLFCHQASDINELDSEGRSPLFYVLLGRQEDPIARRLSALHLLRAGADASIADDNGNTAMHYAAAYGDASLVSLLNEHGCNVDSQNATGGTPLHSAAKAVLGTSREVVDALIAAGATTTIKNSDDQTARDLCLSNPKCLCRELFPASD